MCDLHSEGSGSRSEPTLTAGRRPIPVRSDWVGFFRIPRSVLPAGWQPRSQGELQEQLAALQSPACVRPPCWAACFPCVPGPHCPPVAPSTAFPGSLSPAGPCPPAAQPPGALPGAEARAAAPLAEEPEEAGQGSVWGGCASREGSLLPPQERLCLIWGCLGAC